MLSSNLVINHNNIIVMERKLAEDKTIQGHTKRPNVSGLKKIWNCIFKRQSVSAIGRVFQCETLYLSIREFAILTFPEYGESPFFMDRHSGAETNKSVKTKIISPYSFY